MDIHWNFEEAPFANTLRLHRVAVHTGILIDSYRHVRDWAALVSPGGHIILQTVLPGFPYHRHPVDCMRFYLDWLEEIAKRLALTIADSTSTTRASPICPAKQRRRSQVA